MNNHFSHTHQQGMFRNPLSAFRPDGLFGLRIVLVLLSISWTARATESPRPNVLFIAIDDLRDWVGFMGGYKARVFTPNLDRLAARGTAFLNAHTASPVCCPSRAAVMTGLMPSSSGVYNNRHWWRPHRPELVTIPMHFKRHGYTTVGAGKIFHHTVGNNPPDQWDDFKRLIFNDDGFSRLTQRYRELYPFTRQQPKPDPFPLSGIVLYSPEVDWGALTKPEIEFDDAQSAQYGIDFLAQKHAKPFFLACGIFRPHLPWYIPQKYLDMYPLESIRLPTVPEDDLDDIPKAGKILALRKAVDLKKVRDAGQWKTAVRHYLASITFADTQVGRLLDALDRSPYKWNTIIVLWSDHGWHLGEKNHWHKRTLWEAGTRVPFIVSAPGIGQPNQRCQQPVSLLDIYPTLVELCRLPPVKGLDGVSLTPQLHNPTKSRSRPAVIQSEEQHVAIRNERYRYIRYRDGSEELYDHQSDPNEWRNRAGDDSLNPVKSELARWVPTQWAKPADSKQAYEFDPLKYRWKHKRTGTIVTGK